ncbi:XPG domain containing-domain-containing protein [Hypomontagnella monticulosa]|nr:XPG domain containing-domain-containing protein [Hypomontagnella monticulosa]
MGIRGLGQAVQRYGVFSPLSGDSVVIDGPALVHRISEACMKQRAPESGFVCHPPYSLLSRMVIGWLDELKNHNVDIRKIYFDGYLPPSKWDVRRERLLNQSRHMKAFVSSQPFGSAKTPENAFGDMRADMTLTKQVGRSSDTYPKPPFMVPAVLEALKSSNDWGPLVIVVPGEADVFCAQDIRVNGGTLLTNDSDLLIQDLGPNGNVSFFWDIVPAGPTSKEPGMTTCKISLSDINDRLGLADIGGLPRVAFEMQTTRVGFNAALQKARDSREDTLNSPEYQSFVKELKLREYIPHDHPVLGILSGLDPRISEVVVQTLLLDEKETQIPTPDIKTSRGPDALSIFLPIVVENRDKRSAWTTSTDIRQIAYSILQNLTRQASNTIIEYRTLDPSTTLAGRQIAITSLEETMSNCSRLVAVIKKLTEHFPSLDMQWLAFAVYLDIKLSTSEQRKPLSVTIINKAANQPEDMEAYSWDLIHLTAQVQACLYSLRIEKQIFDTVLFMGRDLPVPAQQLHGYLASLPSIADWPTVERMFGLLSDFSSQGGLAVIADMLRIPRIKLSELPTDSSGSRKRQKQDQDPPSRKGGRKAPKKSPSINPYAILSQASQDV